jgi:hypothetical protein
MSDATFAIPSGLTETANKVLGAKAAEWLTAVPAVAP